MSTSEIQEYLREPESSVRSYLMRLKREGLIEKTGPVWRIKV